MTSYQAADETAPQRAGGSSLSGAPPTETGPKGLDSRDVLLRDATRARAFGMEEVVSGACAFCRESARSEESWFDNLFRSVC